MKRERMKVEDFVSAADVREAFRYDAESGGLFWKHRSDLRWFNEGTRPREYVCAQWNSKFAGRLTGCVTCR